MNIKTIFKVVTPIFIGSGEEYYPNDYIALEDELCFIDRKKLLDEVIKQNRFDEFIKVSENMDRFLDFIYNFCEKIDPEKICKDFIEASDEILDRLSKTNSRPLEAFIKDQFLFKPLIPGSTIKGAIRTAVFNYILKQNSRLKEENPNKLEAEIFCNSDRYDAKNDFFKVLFVDDFKPVNYKLRVISPLNYPKKSQKINHIPVYLETLIDGEFVGEIRIDENLMQSLNNPYFNEFNIDFIKKALKDFYLDIIKEENQRFKKVDPQKYEDYKIKIGRFSGAGSKSLDIRKVYIRQLKKSLDYQTSVWAIDKKPMGWGKLEFKGN